MNQAKKRVAYGIAFALRVFGWLFAIGAVLAKLNDFQGAFAFVYDQHNLSFYVLAGGFTELLFQVVKLKGQLDEARK